MTTQTYTLQVVVDASSAQGEMSKLSKIFSDIEHDASRMSNKMKTVKSSLDGVKTGFGNASKSANDYANNTDKVTDKQNKLMGALGKVGSIAAVALGAIGGVAGVISNVGQAQREFDVLNAQLITATGSAEKAGQVFGELQKFAKETPYGLAQATEGYAKLKNLGLDPSIDSLRSFGNTASAMGKDLNQMIEAVADASTGEFERLKEFGIKAKKQGSDVEFTFQGVTTTVKNNSKDIQKYLLDIGNVNFAGAMSERMNSLDGAIAGFDDTMQNFWLTLSKSGVGDVFRDVVNNASDVIEKFTEKLNDPTVVDGFKTAIDGVKTAFELLKGAITGIGDLLAPIGNFFSTNPELTIALASGLTAAATAYFVITGAMSLFATVSGAVAAAGGLAAMATTALGAAIAFLTSPITLTVAAIAALVAIGVYLYRNWDTLGQKASEVWNGIKQWASDAWQGVVDTWNGFTEWFGGLFDGFGLDGIWDSLTSGVSSAWESVKTTIAQKWESIKAWFSGNGDLLSGVWQSIKDGVSNAWDSIKQAVIDKFNQIKEAFNEWLSGQPAPVQEMIDNIISIFTSLVAGIGAIWGLVGSGASAAWDGIKTAASTAKEWVQSTWEGLSSGLSSTWESIKSGASSAWESAKSTASSAWESVKNTVSSKLEQAKTTASKLSDGVARGWDNAKELAGRAFDGVKNAIGDKLGQAKDTAKSKFDEIKNSISNSGIGEAMSKGLNTLTSIASSALNGVKAVFSAAITAWRAILQAGLTIFATLFNTAFNTIKTVVQTAFAVIKGVITGDVNAIKTAFSNGFNQLGNIARQAGQNILSAFKNLGSQLLQAGRDAVQGFINGFTGKMGEALSKAREMASKIISTVKGALDIHSPSRKMKQLGEWVSEGLAIGIEYKTPMVEKSASDLAKAAKDAFESEMTKLSRDIFLTQQKIAGNPFAELTTDIKFGKYDGVSKEKLDELIYLTNKSRIAQQGLEIREKNLQIARDIANVSKTEKELFFEQFELFDEMYQGAINNLKLKYDELQTAKNTHNLTQKIKELDEKILLTGKSELEVLQYQLDNAKEYWGVSDDIKQSYLDRTKALQEAVKAEERLEKIKEKGKNFEKSKYLINNRKDPDAQLKYELGKDGYNDEQIAKMVKFAEYERQLKSVSDLMDKLEQKTLFGDAVNTANLTNWGGSFDFVTQFYQKQAQLDKVFSDEQSNLKQALDNGLITLQDHQEQEALLIEQHEAKKRQLKETSNQAILAGASSLMKTMYGENSKHYKWTFGLEKAYAISRILLQNKVALANAWASAPFPANLGAVAKVVAESGMLVSAVNAIKPIGQAHDGIMSVPKSGTWNLEKGERVLPRHTAKALDDKLDSVGNGTNQINIHINIDNNGNEQSPNNAQGTAKILADNIKAVVLQTLHQEKKQGGLLA